MSPVAMCLEELIPSRHLKSQIYPILIRTALVISTLLVGLTIPFFGKVLHWSWYNVVENQCCYSMCFPEKLCGNPDIYESSSMSYCYSYNLAGWFCLFLIQQFCMFLIQQFCLFLIHQFCRSCNGIDWILTYNACGMSFKFLCSSLIRKN